MDPSFVPHIDLDILCTSDMTTFFSFKKNNTYLDNGSSLRGPNLGPLHIRAKSRGQEIVRVQKKVSKAVTSHLQNHVVRSRTLKCSVKVICDRALVQMLFQ